MKAPFHSSLGQYLCYFCGGRITWTERPQYPFRCETEGVVFDDDRLMIRRDRRAKTD